jgi:hypothetical protein
VRRAAEQPTASITTLIAIAISQAIATAIGEAVAAAFGEAIAAAVAIATRLSRTAKGPDRDQRKDVCRLVRWPQQRMVLPRGQHHVWQVHVFRLHGLRALHHPASSPAASIITYFATIADTTDRCQR